MSRLHVEKRVLGAVSTNCYLAFNEETKEGFFVDPADRGQELKRLADSLMVRPVAILLTHGHFDHIGAAMKLKKEYQIPIYAGEAERVVLEDSNLNLSGMFGLPFIVNADCLVKDKEQLKLAGFEIQVLHTPGHTRGGVCYYIPEEQTLFSGDTLFYESIGRTDYPTGNGTELTRSVRSLLEGLPEQTAVYPGHESVTDIAHEKICNPFA